MTAHKSWKSLGAVASLVVGMAAGASFTAAQAAPVFNNPSDVKAIAAVEEDLQAAIDMTKIMHHYAPDVFVLDMYAPGIYKGQDQVFNGFQPQFAVVQSMTHTFPEMNIASDGKLACAALQVHFDTLLKNGQKLSMTVRELDAFKKTDGEWRLIQSHISMPTDPKTGMAVTDGPLPVRPPMTWLSTSPFQDPSVTPEVGKAEIRHWMDVGTLSTSIDQMMPYYGPDDNTLVYDTYVPGEMRGLKEVHDYYAPLMGSYNSVQVKMPEFVADSDGTFGVQIDTQDMKLAMKDGSTRYISLRQNDCLRRVNGKWYTFFEMVSYPVDPKTGKSITENPGAFQ